MKMKKETIISIAVIAVCLIAGIVVVVLRGGKADNKSDDSSNKTSEIIKANTNENVIKDQTVDIFSFKNTNLIYDSGTSTLTTEVTNTSNSDADLQEFKIHVSDKEGKEIITLTGFVGGTIKAGETKNIVSSYGDDLSNAEKVTYEIVK